MANPKARVSVLTDTKGKPMITVAQALVADALVTYTDTGDGFDLDTDARRVAAMNASNAKINSILDILETHGLMKDA